MAEVALLLELVARVLRVVDQHVHPVAELEHVVRDEVVRVVGAARTVVGHVGDREALEVDPVPERRAA